MIYIGLDVGTSSCKAAAIDSHANILAYSSRQYDFVLPERGYVELDPETIWQKCCEVLREIAPFCREAKALAISGIGESFVLLDAQDLPLNRFIVYLDQRCTNETAIINAHIREDRLYEITGLTNHPMYSLSKILWLQKNRSDLWIRAKKLMLFSEYINYRLTGCRMVDYGSASRTMLFDTNSYQWSSELLTMFKVDPELLAPICAPGTLIGKLSEDVRKALNLSEQIQVYLGSHDQVAACLGTGILEPGEAMAGEGSSESINMVASHSIRNRSEELRKHQIHTEPYLSKESLIIPMGILCFGNSMRWYINTFEKELYDKIGDDIYPLLDSTADEETDLLFFPYLSKVNIMDADSCAEGAFLGLTIETRRKDIYRAVLDGLHFESRKNFELLKKLGIDVKKVIVTGGMSKSSLSMQLKADIFNHEILVSGSSEAGVFGLVIICAVACGDVETYKEAIESFIKHRKKYKPKCCYDKKYSRYLKGAEGIKQLSHLMNET